MAKIEYRVMDTDNGGIVWTDWQQVEIEDTEDADEMAQRLNRANYQAITDGDLEEGDEAPGTLLRAAGDGEQGIAWFDDRGHQGATDILIEWRTPEAAG
ncbi:MAG TPA: hypothetical protein VIE65_04230 [Methylobacter sp.]|jgi:hypothetical protein